MSAAEHSRDDAEPPSRLLSSRFTVSFSIDEAVDASSVPPREKITTWVEHAIAGIPTTDKKPAHFDVSVSVVDEATIQSLNSEYRSNNKPTNVLSFPSGMPLLDADSDAGTDELGFQALGDIVVCQSVIVHEAHEQNKTIEHHFAHMLVHSVLHLFGYDHQVEHEANLMEALEIQLLSNLSIPNPYQLSFQSS